MTTKPFDVELRKIDEIQPYEGNPRINDSAVDAVAASLKEFGFRQPIVVDENGVIVCGHTRWKAAKKLGLAKVPVHVATDLTPEQIKAYRIADNQTATLAEWDFELLPIELKDLQGADYDLELLGFDQDELAKLLDGELTEGLTDPDDVPAPPDDAITQPGDIWVLGDHRLMCGDSAKTEDVDRLLDGAMIHLVNSDPPYNVRCEPRSNNAVAAGNSSFQGSQSKSDKKAQLHHQSFDEARFGHRKPTDKKLRPKDRPLENDFLSDEEFDRLLRAWFGNGQASVEITPDVFPGGLPHVGGPVNRRHVHLRRWPQADVHVAGEMLRPPPGALRQVTFGQGLQPPSAAAKQPLAVAATRIFAKKFAVFFAQLAGGHLLQFRQFLWDIGLRFHRCVLRSQGR